MFNPGNMDTTAEFYRPPAERLTAMGAVADDADVLAFTRMSMVMFLRGRERLEAQKTDAEIDAKIVVWLDEETKLIEPTWYIKAVGKTFGVQYIVRIPGGERAQRLEIFCRTEA